ncbi:MAG: hypothetical protein KJ601_04885 [Nanoarchaeota archaeon]|nr:hypothetical protein [Nanoarchaeota archaeon]
MECKINGNKQRCSCLHTECSRHGICCECISYHLSSKELPACCFSKEIADMDERSFDKFIEVNS